MNTIHDLMDKQAAAGGFSRAPAGCPSLPDRPRLAAEVRSGRHWPGFSRAALPFLCLCLAIPPTVAQSTYPTAYTFSTLAGSPGSGSADGVGSGAQFNLPRGVAADGAGNLYVADSGNATIRKVTPAGVVTTIAGVPGVLGSADGTNGAARFAYPQGLALDALGRLYVIDSTSFTIRLISPVGADWAVSTIAGSVGQSGTNDGVGTSALFSGPTGLTVGSDGSVYVIDEVMRPSYHGTGRSAIRKLAFNGTNWTVTTLLSSVAVAGGNNFPVDGAGSLYVPNGAEGGAIWKLAPSGSNWTQTLIAGGGPGLHGYNDGIGTNAGFYWPLGVALDNGGILYVTDTGNCTIRKMQFDGTNWNVTTLAGLWSRRSNRGNSDGTGTNALFNLPEGITTDSAGDVYVTDTYNNTIRKVTSVGVVSTVAGATQSSGSTDGTGNAAKFFNPSAVAVDSAGTVYVADTYNQTIRKVTSAGIVSTLAGLAGSTGTNDGPGGYARFDYPSGVAVDSAGNVFVADEFNRTIRKITPPGEVSTLAGLAGSMGHTDGVGTNASFGEPVAVAVDSAGNIYVTDWLYDNIRKITPLGEVSTIAGSALQSGSSDGMGTNARFNHPSGVTVDSATNVYIADSMNHAIRKITPVGTNWQVSTIAGSPTNSGSADGSGTVATFTYPQGISVDSAGNVYVADGDGQTIRKVTRAGTDWIVSTIGGVAGSRGSTDGSGSAARFSSPSGIAANAGGLLYIADSGNNTIRKGVFTAYGAANRVPYTPPGMNAHLVVTLLPAEANGQWRFPWELGWHASGEGVSNLVAGNYPLEFRDVPGYLAFPPTLTAALSSGTTTEVTNQYYPTFDPSGTTNAGVLGVNIGPAVPSGAGWRFLGETTWRTPGSTAAELLPGTYFIEFVPVSGYSKPASQAVQVSAGAMTAIWASYLLAQSAPAGVWLPAPVPAASMGDLTNYPYGFNGQLQSDVGDGSGVAVLTNVVLTAAHLVFNDQALSYVSQVYWRFRQEAGVFVAKPQAARGWYILGGYAVQRTNDVLGGLGPGRSSPQSRNLDVAALYFQEPVAGGGYGGYLPSDTVPNAWLTSTSQKMLVGYPVDGSSLGDASIVPGVMYQVGPQPYPLSLATDPLANQQVYLAPWLLSYPGNSGGPFYVQFNGYFYPAGVYLGTLYSGVVPYASVVRGIDSNVVNLITWAQALGDSGTNSTGGGVITIRAGSGSGLLAYLQVNIGPQAALDAGGAWRVQGTTAWSGGPTYTAAIAAGDSVTLEFKPVAGWTVPANNTVQITLGQLTIVPATYTSNPAQLVVTPASGLAASGFAGGPFSPSAATYTLTNSGGAGMNWSVGKTADWVSLSASSGFLVAGAKTNITVSLNAGAKGLVAGTYTNTVGFTNLGNGLGNTSRPVSLTVSIHPLVQLTNPRLLTNGSLTMTLLGVTNRVYSVLGITNLLEPVSKWTEVLRLTNAAGQTLFTITNPASAGAPQFYRAREL
jgi:sugar lactone lactonase YvrE